MRNSTGGARDNVPDQDVSDAYPREYRALPEDNKRQSPGKTAEDTPSVPEACLTKLSSLRGQRLPDCAGTCPD